MSIGTFDHMGLPSPLEDNVPYVEWEEERKLVDWRMKRFSHGWCATEDLMYSERTPSIVPHSSLQVAMRAYQQGRVSLGRAAEIANLPYDKMIDALRKEGIPLRFGTPVEVAEKRSKQLVETLRKLRRGA